MVRSQPHEVERGDARSALQNSQPARAGSHRSGPEFPDTVAVL
jgi:hypothetical protein